MADNVIIQQEDTSFARNGLTTNSKGYSLPTLLASYIYGHFQTTGVGPSVAQQEQNLLYALLTQDAHIIPGGQTLYNVQALNPSAFIGAAELAAIYEQDPFSTSYETSTNSAFDRAFLTARAVAQTGPVNVRGGTARQAFEIGEIATQQSIQRFREVWQNTLATAALVVQAVQVANVAEGARYDLQLKAQQLQAGTEQGKVMQSLSASEQMTRDRESHIRACAAGGEFLGVPFMRTEEALAGRGSQSGSNTGFGMSYWR